MSTQARGIAAQETEDEKVARYLQQNPDFFERNTTLLAQLKLPHVRTGATISLVERQVEVLRERHAAIEQKLGDFVRVARDNDALAEKIHRFTRRLLRAPTRDAVIEQLEASLREDFDAFHSQLILVGHETPTSHERFLRVLPADDANLRSFETLFAGGRPRCGQVRDQQRDFLFGTDAATIGSLALVPLGEKGAVGLLVLGSTDRNRFHPGMSTEFLARMADLIADALKRP